MTARLAAFWERLWYTPASPLGLLAARTLLAAQALWIVLSRPDLPELTGWPRELWRFVDPALRLRFGIAEATASAEPLLFLMLHGTLVATLLGVAPRLATLLSAALLYHFAPFEELLVGMPYTSFGGLTLPTAGLFVLAFAVTPRWRSDPSPEYRWPLALLQVLFSFNYLFPGLLKLRYSGLGWFTGPAIEGFLVANDFVTRAPWALWIAGQPALCWAIALGTLGLELGFPLAVVSRRAALVLVPLAVAFHLGIIWSLGYFFPSLPLLLLFVDWDRLDARLRRVSRGGRAGWRGAPRESAAR
jgi:hypothetical protein